MSWRAIYRGCVVMLAVTFTLMVALGLWLTALANACTSVAFASLIYVAKTNTRSGE
jgi:uncharacterized protein YqfA (UPF0365 family)